MAHTGTGPVGQARLRRHQCSLSHVNEAWDRQAVRRSPGLRRFGSRRLPAPLPSRERRPVILVAHPAAAQLAHRRRGDRDVLGAQLPAAEGEGRRRATPRVVTSALPRQRRKRVAAGGATGGRRARLAGRDAAGLRVDVVILPALDQGRPAAMGGFTGSRHTGVY